RAAGDDDVAATAVHLEYLERLRVVHQRRHVADRADVDLRARQEGHGAVEVDGEAALDLVEDDAVDGHVLFNRNHLALDDGAFLKVSAGKGFIQHRGKIVAAGVVGICRSSRSHLFSKSENLASIRVKGVSRVKGRGSQNPRRPLIARGCKSGPADACTIDTLIWSGNG